jgi:hypothetical protein
MLRLDPLLDRSDQRLHRLELRRQHNDARPRIDRQTCILLDVFRQRPAGAGAYRGRPVAMKSAAEVQAFFSVRAT